MGMNETTSPTILRAACRAKFFRHIETLADIAEDPESSDASRIKAIDTLGRFGLGAADQAHIHLHSDGKAALGVVWLPPIEAPGNSEPLPSQKLTQKLIPPAAPQD
jgi:hypothetical protein